MSDYKSMYLTLFNRVTDAIETLQQAQRAAEELYISGSDTEDASEDNGYSGEDIERQTENANPR
ncbi:MAG: hypothetical protein LBN02_04350 [Oscillospiraceae bacterium]|jgi:biotin carboxylase|nr:hypothetical protein [Oscillospiraceae bacterium]